MPRHAEDERLFLNKKYVTRYGEGYVLHKYFAKYLLYSAINIIYYMLIYKFIFWKMHNIFWTKFLLLHSL